MWKAAPRAALLFAVCCTAFLVACSGTKGARAPSGTSSPFDNALVSKGQEDVRKKLGDPTVVSRTMEDHILWVYTPKFKIIPNDKGTLYVEFENGKVIKIFQKK
jgi:hypothetical protein